MGCFGGTSSTTTVQSSSNTYDPVYTAKMADIAERQQQMGEEQWNMYKQYFQDYEIAAAQANKDLLPYITEASRLTLEEQTRDIEANAPVKDALRQQQMETIGQTAPVQEKFYQEALGGVDVGKRQAEAGGEAANQLMLGEQTRRRNLSRMGLSPESSAGRDALRTDTVTGAGLIGGARNQARAGAETENFNRLGYALGFGSTGAALPGVQSTQGQGQTYFGNADPYARAVGTYGQAASTYAPLASRVLSSSGTTTTEQPKATFMDFVGNIGGQMLGSYAGGYGSAKGFAAGGG